MVATSNRFVLRHLPVSARLAVSTFLISVGLGYLMALVQLHYQHAQKGEVMPTPDDAARIFHDKNFGKPPAPPPKLPICKIEELITADRKLKLNGHGQMRTPFDTESDCWDECVENLAKEKSISEAEAKKLLMAEREGEFLPVLKWIQARAPKQGYEDDAFPLPDDWKKDQPITAKYVNMGGKSAKVKTIITDRCVPCHGPDGPQAEFPLDSYEAITKYLPPAGTKPAPSKRQPAMGIEKLAQTSHVHMLGFAMLYGLTGIMLAFTTYGPAVRVLLCPLPLMAQVVDISCWWLARLDPPYGIWAAKTIPITGGIVAVGLFLQIMLTLFDMYGRVGRTMLVLLIALVAGGGGAVLKPVIEKELADEKPAITNNEEEPSKEKKEEPGQQKDKKEEPAKDKDGKKKDR